MPAAASTTRFWLSTATSGEIASVLENIRPMIETAPLEQAAAAYARMMQAKQDSEWCWLQRTKSLPVFGLPHERKVSL
jgi:hypothetical protein